MSSAFSVISVAACSSSGFSFPESAEIIGFGTKNRMIGFVPYTCLRHETHLQNHDTGSKEQSFHHSVAQDSQPVPKRTVISQTC